MAANTVGANGTEKVRLTPSFNPHFNNLTTLSQSSQLPFISYSTPLTTPLATLLLNLLSNPMLNFSQPLFSDYKFNCGDFYFNATRKTWDDEL